MKSPKKSKNWLKAGVGLTLAGICGVMYGLYQHSADSLATIPIATNRVQTNLQTTIPKNQQDYPKSFSTTESATPSKKLPNYLQIPAQNEPLKYENGQLVEVNTTQGDPFAKERAAWAKMLAEHPFSNRPVMSRAEWKKITKFTRPDLAFEQDYLRTMDPALGYVPNERRLLAGEKTVQKMHAIVSDAAIPNVTWQERGPNNVGGRTRALMFDPNDATNKKVWAGGVSGGLWVTNDITQASTNVQWTQVSTPGSPWSNLAISSITSHPANNQIFYVGTGEGFANGAHGDQMGIEGGSAVRGGGIWRSTDAGANWTRVPNTENMTLIHKIVVVNSGAVFVATPNGLFRSPDGTGGTGAGAFVEVNAGNHTDLEYVRPTTTASTHFLLAGLNNGSIIKSATGTAGTWATPTTLLAAQTGGSRVELAVAPSDTQTIYALTAKPSNSGAADVFSFKKSTNGGGIWTDLPIPIHFNTNAACALVPAAHFTNAQSWFAMTIAINPTNPDILIVGGLDLHRSINGGGLFTHVSSWVRGNGCSKPYVHADQHITVFRPGASDEAIFGHDGGVSYSANVGNGAVTTPAFFDKSNTYNVTQFYACAVRNEINSNNFLAGAQDNGTPKFTQVGVANTTEAGSGGDGAFCHIDQQDGNIQINSTQNNSIARSLDGGATRFQSINNASEGYFINPSDYDSQNKILYTAGANNTLRRFSGMDLVAIPTGTSITNDFGGEKISAFKVSPYTNNVLFLGIGNGKVFKVTNANATPTFTEITGDIGAAGFIICIEVGANDNNLIAVMSNYGVNSIWETTNGGTNWVNKDNATLPDMPIRWALYNPANRNQVMLATETGVWSTTNFNAPTTATAPEWTLTSTALGNVRCDMLKYRPADKIVVVATHGRGLFTSDVFVTTPVANFDMTPKPQVSCTGSLTVNFTDGSIGANNSWAWDVDNNGTTDYTTPNPTHTYTTPGVYSPKLTINNGAATVTKTNEIVVMTAAPKASTCVINGGVNNGNSGNNGLVGISRFSLGSINNVTSHNDGMYQDYTCTQATVLIPATSYNVTVTTGTLNNEGAVLYIDYNDNGVFTDAGEEVLTFPSNTVGTRTLSFTTPAASAIVQNRGLRARIISLGTGNNACSPRASGQVEDYTVLFQNPTLNANFDVTPKLSCTGSLTANFTDASSTITNNTYAWDVDNNGTTDYTTRNPTHTYTVAGTYSPRLTINNGAATITKTNEIIVMNAAPTASTGCTITANSNLNNAPLIGIARFTLGAINNITATNEGHYNDYACTHATVLSLNTDYNVTITTGTTNDEGAKVYIDYNDNGTFEEATEMAVSFPLGRGTRTATFRATTAILNKGLRARVISQFAAIPADACDVGSGANNFGQAEDYTVFFQTPTLCPTIVLAPTSLPNGTTGTAYNQTVSQTGGNGAITWSVSTGTLPTGLSLNTTSGAITGTPTAAGTFNFAIKATDANACFGQRSYTVVVACPTITLSPTTLPNGTNGTAYNQTVSSTGGNGTLAYTITAGALPTGLSLAGATGVISGTPTANATFNFTVTVTDGNNCTGTQAYTLIISAAACPTITVTPATLPNPTIGTAYNQTVSSTGGNGAMTYSVVTGTLPAGLSLNATTGVISGTPTALGASGFEIRATDANACTGDKAYNITVVCQTITLSPTNLPNGVVGTAYSQTVSQTGGNGATTLSLTGTLPTGLTFNAGTGVVSGTPTATGTFNFTITATDANNCTANTAYSVVISAAVCPTITVTPATLPNPTIGTAYNQTLSSTSGTGAMTYSIVTGTLPTGLSLNTTTGVISGTPTATGSFGFGIRATDANACTGDKAYTVVVACQAITLNPTTLPNGTIGTAYNQTVSENGAIGAITRTITTGTLPAGLTFNVGTGTISGTPTTAGTSNFTVRITDANACFGETAYTIVVACPTITVTPATLTTATTGTAYTQTMAETGGVGTISWSVSAGTLPAGLSLNATTGVLSGTATATGTFNFTIRATGGTCFGETAYTFTVACGTITVAPNTLPNGTIGTAYNQTATQTGGNGTIAWTIATGTLPTGVTLNATTGAITGTPTATGTFNFTVRATDANTCNGQTAYTVVIACPTITLSPATLPNGTNGTAYNQTISQTGGVGAITYSVSTGTLPNGLTLDANTGVLSGTPTVSNTFNFGIRATDANNCFIDKAYSVTISAAACPTITVTPSTLPNTTIAAAYNQTVSSTGGTGAITYAISTGALPTGLSINATSGVISGTSTALGTFNFTVRATDANACTGQTAYTVVVACPTITVTPNTLANATTGVAYNRTISSTGGNGVVTYTVTAGTLPVGITLSTTGVLSGTTTATGTFNFTVTATDANNCSGQLAYTLTVTCATITVSPTTLANGTTGVAYNQTLSQTGGNGTVNWTLIGGTLPTGVTLNGATGVLSGTPTVAGSFGFGIRATDANACTGVRTYTVVISCPTVTVNPTTLPNGTIGTAYNQTVSLLGGTGATTFAVTTGTLPAGLTLNTTTGVINGIPTTAGTSTFTITATDANACSSNRAFTVVISCATITLSPTTLPNGTNGTAYNQTITQTGGTGITWSVVTGTLPTGLTLNTTTGVISGTPTANGTYGFGIQATAANGCTGVQGYSVTISAAACPTITVSPLTLPNTTLATAYNQTVSSTGGTGAITYAISIGALPTGLSINATSGVISGTSTALGTFNFTVRATDASSCTGQRAYTVVVACPTITLNPTTVPNGTIGVAYTQTLTQTGGSGATTWAVSAGTLPTGITLNATTGVLSGTPTALGTFNFTVRATDANTCQGTESYTIVIACPTITVTPATGALPATSTGVAYSQTISQTGGNGTINWTVASGTLPAGLSLNSTSGIISGTPTATGTFTFSIRATDGNTCQGQTGYSLTVGCGTITVNPTSLPNAVVNTSYNQTVTQTGGTGAITWAISAGALPTGLTLNTTSGVISGTVSATGTFNFTVRATDANTCQGTRAYTVVISCPTITINPTTLSNGVNGTAYSQTFTQTGGNGAITWAVATGTLPTGVTLNATTGVLSGTPTANGTFAFAIRATDAFACQGIRSYSVVISAAACPTITVNPSALTAGTTGTAYSQTVTQTGGTGAITWSVATGTLPTGITLNATTGVLSGTPTVSGTFTFTLRATDVNACTGQTAYSLVINCQTITMNPATLPNGTTGTAYNQTVSQTGANGATTLALTGTLPTGLSFNATTGVISGTPTAAGTFTFTVTATDANGCQGTRNYTIVIACPTIVINPTSLANGTTGTAYTQTLTQTGGTGAVTFSLIAGVLPNGLTLNGTTGVISGTPTVAGTFGFGIRATDANTCIGTRTYSVVISTTVCPTITVAPATLPNGTAGTAYNQTLTQTGGVGAITWSIATGTLPTGLTLNATTGVISGTPTVANTYDFSVRATDAGACVGTTDYTVDITCATITLNPTTLSTGTAGTAYTQTITQTGATGAVTFSLFSGDLPNGLTLNTATGVISGTPTETGSFDITIDVTDANGCIGEIDYTLVIACPTINVIPTGAALTAGTSGSTYTQAFTQSGGIGANTFSISAGALPAGLTLSATGNLTGTITAVAGTYNFTVQATDVNNCTGVRAYSIVVSCGTITLNPTTLAGGNVSSAYSQTITQTGGASPITYAVSAGTLPAGLSLNATTGVISGTPTAVATSTFTITATAANLCTGSRAYSIVIAAAVIVPPPPAPQQAQTITFTPITDVVFGTAPFNVVATASSGLTVTFTVISGNATLNGNVVTATGVGEVIIEATQAGNASFLAAVPVRRTFKVTQATQTLTFDAIADRAWNSGDFFVNASSSVANLPITYTVTAGNNIASILTGNIVRLSAAVGTVTITASQAGNANYSAATSVSRTFQVIKANQTANSSTGINTINMPSTTTFGTGNVSVSATSVSGLPVAITLVSGNATLVNGVLTITGAGNIVVSFAQAGNDLWNAATTVERTLVVAKANQELRLTNPTEMLIGSTQTLVASATSGLPVSMRVVSGTGTVNGLAITPTAGNVIVLEISQAGNANFNAAVSQTVSITVLPTLSIASISDARLCAGAAITVNVTVTGLFTSNNRMAVYLSDANGNFDGNRQLIGAADLATSGAVVGIIPRNTLTSKNYKIRVEGASPQTISSNVSTIEINALPEIATITQEGATLVSSVATGVQWYYDGVAIAGATSAKYTPTDVQIAAKNSYAVVITSPANCVSTSVIYFNYMKPVPTGIDNPALSAKLTIYPNATTDKLNVEMTLEKIANVNLKLTDAAGKVVIEQNITPNSTEFKHEIDMTDYASGTYILLFNVNGKTAIKKVVKQ